MKHHALPRSLPGVNPEAWLRLIEALPIVSPRPCRPAHVARNGSSIVVLGGSASAGGDVLPGEAYPERLQRQLLDEHGVSVRMTNAAQGSARTPYALTLLDSLSAWPADVVIWEFAMNDAVGACITRPAFSEEVLCVLEAFVLRLASQAVPPTLVVIFLWPCGAPSNFHYLFENPIHARVERMLAHHSHRIAIATVDVTHWLRGLRNASEASGGTSSSVGHHFRSRTCHPSALTHALISDAIAWSLVEAEPPHGHIECESDSRPPNTADVVCKEEVVSGRLVPSHSGGIDVRILEALRSSESWHSWLAWSPSYHSPSSLIMSVGRANASRVVGWCDVRNRRDCKTAPVLPCCGDGQGPLVFKFRRPARVLAATWKANGHVTITTLGASAAQVLSPNSFSHGCFRALDDFRHVPRSYQSDEWWLVPEGAGPVVSGHGRGQGLIGGEWLGLQACAESTSHGTCQAVGLDWLALSVMQ